MSLDSARSRVASAQRDLQSVQRRLSDVAGELARVASRINSAQSSASRTASTSSLQSKLREIEGLQRDAARLEDKRARLLEEQARKTEALHRAQDELYREQGREQERSVAALERRLKQTQEEQRTAAVRTLARPAVEPKMEYDAFVSHASEDKAEVARPLAEALQRRGHRVWYDEFELRVGDSLRRSIDKGLASSKFGVVVLSPSFFAKNWPQYELDGMIAKEVAGGKVVLPLWHKVSKNEVLGYSPTLADRVALNTATLTIEEIADELSKALRSRSNPGAS